jgi:hypothetical protein
MAKAMQTVGELTGAEVKPSPDLFPALLALLEFIGGQIAHGIIEDSGAQNE